LFCLLYRAPFDHYRALNTVATVWSGMLISITNVTMKLFIYVLMPNGKNMVRSIPELEYFQKEWLGIFPVTFGSLLVYSIGFLVYVMYGVWKAPQLAATSRDFLTQYRFAFNHLRPSCWWWCLVETLFSLGLVSLQAVSSNMLITLLILVLLVLFTLNLESRTRPYRYAKNNARSIMMKYCLLSAIIMLTAFAPRDEAGTQEFAIGAVLVAVALPIMAATTDLVCWLFKQYFWRTPCISRKLLLLSHNFRNVLVMLLLMPEAEFIRHFQKLDEEECMALHKVLDTLVEVFLEMQSGSKMSQQRVMPGVHFAVWRPEETSLKAASGVINGTLQEVVMEKVRAQIALLSLIQMIKRRVVFPAWPPPTPRRFSEHMLLYFGVPPIGQVTQEDFVKAFASSPTVSEEDLARIFKSFDSGKEGMLPMERILNGIIEKTPIYSSTEILMLNQMRARAMRTNPMDSEASNNEQLDTTNCCSQQVNLLTEVEPDIEEAEPDIEDNDAGPFCFGSRCTSRGS